MKPPRFLFISPRRLNPNFNQFGNNDFDNTRVTDMIYRNSIIKKYPISLLIFKSVFSQALKVPPKLKLIQISVDHQQVSPFLSTFLSQLGMAIPEFLTSFYTFTFDFFFKIKKHLDNHDIIIFNTSTTFIPIIYSRLKNKIVIVDPFGSFFQLSLRNVYSTNILLLPIWLTRLIIAYFIEFVSFHFANTVLVFNQEHQDYLSKTFFLPSSKFHILPIKINHFLPKQNIVKRYRQHFNINSKDYVVLFVGNFLIPQNLVPLKQIIAQSHLSLPNIKYLIVGPTPSDLKFPPNFIIAGFIKDLENIYPLSDLCLAPTSQGSGIKTKILLSLLANKAVITTPQGANFLPNNIDLTVTNPANLVETINQLAPHSKNRSAPNGYKYVLTHFTFKPFTGQLNHLFQNTLNLFLQHNF